MQLSTLLTKVNYNIIQHILSKLITNTEPGPVSYTHLDVYKRQPSLPGQRIVKEFSQSIFRMLAVYANNFCTKIMTIIVRFSYDFGSYTEFWASFTTTKMFTVIF